MKKRLIVIAAMLIVIVAISVSVASCADSPTIEGKDWRFYSLQYKSGITGYCGEEFSDEYPFAMERDMDVITGKDGFTILDTFNGERKYFEIKGSEQIDYRTTYYDLMCENRLGYAIVSIAEYANAAPEYKLIVVLEDETYTFNAPYVM